jgi:cytochrome c biogenesis protein CcmG/thiol:disulfide interchange protein DsbE
MARFALRPRFVLPLIVFVLLAVFLAVGLKLNPREVPSPLIDKPAPEIDLPRLDDRGGRMQVADMAGRVWLLNVWASWCVACRDEHPILVELSRGGEFPIVGLNYKDKRDDALQWLDRFGNPYDEIAVDEAGRVGIDWGVYGVPETFVVDKRGMIRYKHIGPVTRETVEQTILPLARRLAGQS